MARPIKKKSEIDRDLSTLKRADEKSCATLTLKGANDWTPEGRKLVAEWLRQHARDLLKDGHNYTPRFRGRYMAVRP